MKRIFSIMLIIPFFGFSQNAITDTTKIIAVTKDEDAYVGTVLDAEGFKTSDFIIPPSSLVFIVGAKSFKIGYKDFKYYEIAYKGKAYFIYREEVILNNNQMIFDDLLKYPSEKLVEFRKYNITLSEYYDKYQKLNVLKFIETCKPKGLVILRNSIYDESEYTDGTSFGFEIQNLSNKTIKYISFSLVGYNSVNDKITERGSSVKSVKGVGPIGKNESASFGFKYVWYTDLVENFKIINVKIEYMDGSVRIIDSPKSLTLSSLQYKLLKEKD
jgi:hypothetical protein